LESVSSHIPVLYVIGYNNISWRPHDPQRPIHLKIWGLLSPSLSGLTPMIGTASKQCCQSEIRSQLKCVCYISRLRVQQKP